jgi:hypothetical protein
MFLKVRVVQWEHLIVKAFPTRAGCFPSKYDENDYLGIREYSVSSHSLLSQKYPAVEYFDEFVYYHK